MALVNFCRRSYRKYGKSVIVVMRVKNSFRTINLFVKRGVLPGKKDSSFWILNFNSENVFRYIFCGFLPRVCLLLVSSVLHNNRI